MILPFFLQTANRFVLTELFKNLLAFTGHKNRNMNRQACRQVREEETIEGETVGTVTVPF